MVGEVKNEGSRYNVDVKDSLGVTPVAMTIHATTPKLIPILFKERDQVLGDAILFAIEQTREETGQPNSSFVILHDEWFKTEDIYKYIQSKKNPSDNLFKYPPNQEDEPCLDYLNDLMENKINGFLVLKDKTFKGSEAMNIIILMSDGGGSESDIRCNMLRCISNLSIIQLIQEGEALKFDKIRNTLVEPYLPNHEIGIVHFAGKNNDQIRNDKNFVSKIETLDGDIIDKKLRFSS